MSHATTKPLAAAFLLFLQVLAGCTAVDGGDHLPGESKQEEKERSEAVPVPQALPVRNIFKAMETHDAVLFSTVFSGRIAKEKEERGWEAELAGYVALLRSDHARHAEYSYSYEGSREKGCVLVKDGQSLIWRARVVLEAQIWKLDEN
ncbi:MAG: hypothetical protein JKY65_20665 [Planctomycetes bacterium]|nr:hypothetical protein [Planctomycetota bacterium]